MRNVEEFRKIYSLSIKSVPHFSSLGGGGGVIAVDRVKMVVTIPSPLHKSRCFQVLGNKHCTKITTGYWQNYL